MEDKKATQTGSTSANSNSQKQNSSAWSSRSRLTQREGSAEDSSAPPRETESYRLKSRACTLFLTKTEVVKYRIDQFRTSQPSRDNQKPTQNSTSSSSSSSSLSSELLDLSKLQIQSYPASLSSLSSILTKLNLSSNSLVVLPAEIALLENLEELILDNNELVSLPKEIGKLTHLQRLHCYHNKISNLPTEISQLSSLKRLFLGHNNIGYFPPELSALSSLQWLSLDDNNLSSIPPDISSLQSLGYLSLESNQLHSLPKEMADMRSLEFLSIVNNPNLSTLPEYFANFALLKDLRSDNCFLLPKHIADRHEGREILDYLVNVLVRWDLNFNEKAHWELDQNSSKCFKCNSSFTFTKRRHHCRLCGLIFCNRDCDITCEIPGITLPGRCCVDCFSYLDPLSPVNLYRQQQEKKMKAKMRVIGFEDGDENLPLDEKIGKIKGQIKELSDLIVLELNTKDGLIKMLSILDHAMAEDTKQQIIQSDQTLDELNEALNQLRQILHSLTSQMPLSFQSSSSSSSPSSPSS